LMWLKYPATGPPIPEGQISAKTAGIEMGAEIWEAHI
jgi:hypothetical protein